MIAYPSLSNFLFALANGAVIVWGIWYIFTQYIVPQLHAGLEVQESDRVKEQQNYDKLLLEYDALKRARSNQEQEGKKLLHAIERWNNAIKQIRQQEQQQKDQRSRALHLYIQRQQQYRLKMHAQEYVMPRAYKHAQQTLKETYQSTSAGYDLLMDILTRLEEPSNG